MRPLINSRDLGGKVEMVMVLDTGVKRATPLYKARAKLRKGWKHTLDEIRAERSSRFNRIPSGCMAYVLVDISKGHKKNISISWASEFGA